MFLRIHNAGKLSELGISPLRDLPQVGGNLQDHLQLRCAWKVSGGRTLNQLARRWWGKGMIGLQYALTAIKNLLEPEIWLSTSTLEGYDDSTEEEV